MAPQSITPLCVGAGFRSSSWLSCDDQSEHDKKNKPMSETDHTANATHGFYRGFNKIVAITPKLLILLLICWAVFRPENARDVLLTIQNWTTRVFGSWYMFSAAIFMFGLMVLAVYPKTGRIKLGADKDVPEFSTFSWFSMMFGAGVGIGMLTYSTAEPIYHFASNPDVILGVVEAKTAENVRQAYKWSMFHWALTPWGIYGVLGISLAYFSFNQGLPLTIRSSLRPLFGNAADGVLGNVVDVVAILATVIGVAVTIGYGVSQFASGVFNISGAKWLISESGAPTLVAQVLALAVVLVASTISALSGVSKGIKWLSNLNMGLTVFLLVFFVIFGAFAFAAKTFAMAIWDYVMELPKMSFTIWSADTQPELADWQGNWTIFYWAWWVAFAPFVGLFLARVSKGRSIREYVLGAMIVPSLTCLTWFTLVGGTALDMELSGVAAGKILGADISAQLYETINLLLSPAFATAMSVIIVVLLLTYLITSVDSAILVVTTIAATGKQPKNMAKHIVLWGCVFAGVIVSLLYAGGIDTLRSAMIIGALPFSFVMMLMMISLFKSLLMTSKGN